MKVRWLNVATRSLRLIHAHIAYDDPTAARLVIKKIRSSVPRLATFPMSGRSGEVPETRQLIVSNLPYIVVYRVNGDVVEILRVLHTAMNHSPLGH